MCHTEKVFKDRNEKNFKKSFQALSRTANKRIIFPGDKNCAWLILKVADDVHMKYWGISSVAFVILNLYCFFRVGICFLYNGNIIASF